MSGIRRAMVLSFRDPTLGEDIAQEAFYRTLRRWPKVSKLDHPEAWTMVVALNCGRDVARRRRRQSEKAPWLERTEMASGGEAGIDDRLAVVDLLASVTDRQREIIVLRYICQLRVPEIAALLQCAGEAALVIERRDGTRRLYRADHGQMDRLRQFLDEYWTESLQRLQNLAESAEREKGSTDG